MSELPDFEVFRRHLSRPGLHDEVRDLPPLLLEVRRIEAGGRSAWLCPGCQKKR